MRRIVFGALTGAAVLGLASATAAQSAYVGYGQPAYGGQGYATYDASYGAQGYAGGYGQATYSSQEYASYGGSQSYGYGQSYGYDSYGRGGQQCGGGCGGGYVQTCRGGCGGYVPAPPPPPPPPTSYGCGGCYGQGYSAGYGGGYAYVETSRWTDRRGHWDRYRPYAAPDRGGRYGYGVSHDRRGYYERDGYHDDRPPSGRGRGHPGPHGPDCGCYTILDDR